MTKYKTSGELKAIAKERSLDKYGSLILANIIIFIIRVILSSTLTISTSGNILILIINELITIVVSILLGVLVSGKAYMYLNLVYGQTVSVSDIFFGLKQQPNKAIKIQAVFVGIGQLVSLPITIILFIARQTPNPEHIATLIIVVTLGLMVYVFFTLTYSQSFFLLHDFPDKSVKDILRTSRTLMSGNRFNLFYLYVSFIPIIIFGVITLFVPLLWISVYKYATVTAFYQDLMSQYTTGKEENGLN